MARSNGTVVLSRRHTRDYELLRRPNPLDPTTKTVLFVAGGLASAAIVYGIYQLSKKPSVGSSSLYGGFNGRSIDPLSLTNPYQRGFQDHDDSNLYPGEDTGSSSRSTGGLSNLGSGIGGAFR